MVAFAEQSRHPEGLQPQASIDARLIEAKHKLLRKAAREAGNDEKEIGLGLVLRTSTGDDANFLGEVLSVIEFNDPRMPLDPQELVQAQANMKFRLEWETNTLEELQQEGVEGISDVRERLTQVRTIFSSEPLSSSESFVAACETWEAGRVWMRDTVIPTRPNINKAVEFYNTEIIELTKKISPELDLARKELERKKRLNTRS